MTGNLVLREDSIASVQVVRNVYKVTAQYPTSTGGWGQPPFPNFDELFDEFIAQVFEAKTSLTNSEIDEELYELHRRNELDVEHGFQETVTGLNLKMELMDTLMAMQCTFTLNGRVYNSPIQEVW